MDPEYILLTEKEEIWAKMLLDALSEKGIPCTALPLHGAGVIMHTGMRERLRIYVPKEFLNEASEILLDFFPDSN